MNVLETALKKNRVNISIEALADLFHDFYQSNIIFNAIGESEQWKRATRTGSTDSNMLNALESGLHYMARDFADDPEDANRFDLEALMNGFKVLRSKHKSIYNALLDGSYDANDTSALFECAIFGEIIYG